MMDSCFRDQVGRVCAVGARLQGGERLQGMATGGDRSQPWGCLGCPVPAQLLPQVSVLLIKAYSLHWIVVLHS